MITCAGASIVPSNGSLSKEEDGPEYPGFHTTEAIEDDVMEDDAMEDVEEVQK